MSEKKKYSIFIRIICGIIGSLGIAATIFNLLKAENFTFELKLLAIAFSCFIFLYVGIMGTNPLEAVKKDNES